MWDSFLLCQKCFPAQFCFSLLPSCFLPRDGKPGFHSSTELAPFPQPCILIIPYQSLTQLFHTGSFCQASGVFLQQRPWVFITQKRHACRPDYLVAGRQHVAERGRAGRNTRGPAYSSFPCVALNDLTSVRGPADATKGRQQNVGSRARAAFVHVSDVCNDGQVFVNVFQFLPHFPLGLIVFPLYTQFSSSNCPGCYQQ